MSTVVVSASILMAIGWPLREFTPQVDASEYYPTTAGHTMLARLVGTEHRFLASDMRTFYGNSAMVHGLHDLRGHTLQDPQFKQLVDAAAPNAWARDPLKLNVQPSLGEVNLESPALDDLSVRIIALSSDDSPLGTLVDFPTPVGTTRATATHPAELPWRNGPSVGAELWAERRGAGCATATVTLVPVVDGVDGLPSTKPAVDFPTAAFERRGMALALRDVAPEAQVALRVRVDRPGCTLLVGTTGDARGRTVMAATPRLLPTGATWQVVGTTDGWYYRRPAARPLVGVRTDWQPAASDHAALAAATAATRTGTDPVPVAGAGDPEPGGSGRVTSWSEDASGVSSEVRAVGRVLVVGAYNESPGWSVTVDGRPAHLVRPDGALLGVVVPGGTHRIRFEYDPPGLAVGLVISLIAALGIVLFGVGGEISRRRGSGASTGTPAGVAPDSTA